MRKAFFTIIGILIPFFTPVYVFADVLGDRLNNIGNAQDETTFVEYVYQFAVPLAVFSLVALSIYSAYLMITSQGNPDKLAEAKETIVNAVLGFSMVALSIALLALLGGVLEIA